MEPIYNVILGSEPVEMRRDNTSLFLHLGEAAVYDHIYHVRDAGGGTYVPNTAAKYEEIRDFLLENQYPAHVNLPEASDSDKEVLERFWVRDLGSMASFPEEWESQKEDKSEHEQ